jgi:hypothetical protein
LGYAVKRTLGLAPSPLGLPQLAPWAMRLLVGLSALYLLFTAAFLTLGFYTVARLFADPAARHGFVAPFAAALRHGSLLELLQALRSGGVMSVMVLYGAVLVVSLLSAFVARLGVSFARRRPLGPNGQEA